MGAESKSRIGRAVGGGITGEGDIGQHIPQGSEVAVPNRTDTFRQGAQEAGFRWRLLQHTDPQLNEVIESIAEHPVIHQRRGCEASRRLGQCLRAPGSWLRQPTGGPVLTLGDVP